MSKRRMWMCLDCHEDTGKMREHYFVKTEVWMKVHHSVYGMLCVGCLENRLGRSLCANDFTDAHINNPRLYPMSDRLRSRLNA
jgi:hypothetical protein